MKKTIDLNADLGEGFGVYEYGADQELLSLVTSANIACGWHGGDPGIMRRAAKLAVENHVSIGAHPGFPDRMGFGRRYMDLSSAEVRDGLLYQLGALDGICRSEGTAIRYVKPHGAMYNAAAKDDVLAHAVVEAVYSYNPGLILLCPGGSAMERAAKAAGISIASEFFADRNYRNDGSLVPRSQPKAIISDSEQICHRILQAINEGTVETEDGSTIIVQADSICLHGDNPSAVTLACHIRETLLAAGVSLRSFAGRL